MVWNSARIFYSQNLCFGSVKNFLLSSTAWQNFYFLGHCRTMNGLSCAANRKILACSGREVEIFYLRFLENFGFFESKKFLSQGVCTLKFLCLEGIQGNVFTIICQGFIILAGCGRELEFFYLRFLENFHFFESKKFLSQGVCKIKILFLEGW